MLLLSLLLSTLAFSANGRDITFPPVLPVDQGPLMSGLNTPGLPGAMNPFAGLTTFANLPFVQCLKDVGNDGIEAFDIAFLGAPFDTVRLFILFPLVLFGVDTSFGQRMVSG